MGRKHTHTHTQPKKGWSIQQTVQYRKRTAVPPIKCSTLYNNTKVQRDNNTIVPVRSSIVKQFFRGVGNQFIRSECEKHQVVEREDSWRYFTVDAMPVTEISFAGAQVDAEVL